MTAPWQRSWLKSKDNPLIFVRDVLGAIPEPWQAEALEAVGRTRPRVDQVWSRRRQDDLRKLADPVVPAYAPELQGSCGSELSGPAARHDLARDRQVAQAAAGCAQSQ